MIIKKRERYFFCFSLFLIGIPLFAAIPIQDGALRGASATEARQKLLQAARVYLGTPYRYAGVDRRGMDCSGFAYTSFRDSLGQTIPRTAEGIYNWAEKIPASELQPGDLVFFVTVGSAVSHLGIYTGSGVFIHAASEGPNTGVIYSHMSEPYWQRTFKSAGRALPRSGDAESVIASAERNTRLSGSLGSGLAESGYFVGFGASWNWFGKGEGFPSAFRGVSLLASAGYKWQRYSLDMELRPHFDVSLNVFRLPFTLSLGTDTFRVFAGPAYTFGTPYFQLKDGLRLYEGDIWLLEAGASAALPPITIGRGALIPYADLAWQSYHHKDRFKARPDLAANLRLSTGLRYNWYF